MNCDIRYMDREKCPKNRRMISIVMAGLIAAAMLIVISIAPAHSAPVHVEYFHMTGCLDFAFTDPIIKQAEQDYTNVTFG